MPLTFHRNINLSSHMVHMKRWLMPSFFILQQFLKHT